MTMHYRFYVGARPVDFTVDKSLQRTGTRLGIDGIGVEIVFHDVFSSHQGWGEPARHQVTVRIVRVPDAHMTKGIEYALLGKDQVGHDKIFENSRIDRASRGRWRLGGEGNRFEPGEYQSEGCNSNKTGQTDHSGSPLHSSWTDCLTNLI